MKLLITFLLIVVLVCKGSYDAIFDIYTYSYDEGINAIKALLVTQGNSLFTEIWSDQPPFFAFLTALLYKIFGNSIIAFRTATFIIFYLAILALHSIILKLSDKYTAAIAVCGLILCNRILDFSVFALVGLPSICFSIFSIWFLIRSDKNKNIDCYLLIAALLQAAAIMTKIWMVIIFACQLIQIYSESSKAHRLKRTINYTVLSFIFSAAILFSATTSIALAVKQLTATHYDTFNLENQPVFFDRIAYSEIFLYLSAIISAYIFIGNSKTYPLFLNWFIFAIIALSFHKPIWDHHFLLLNFPAIILCAHSVSISLKSRFRKMPAAFSSVLFILFLGASLTEMKYLNLCPYPYKVETQDLQLIARLPEINYMFTNLPYYAFLLNKPIPPEIAVLSSKRLATGNINSENLSQIINKYKPEVLLFSNSLAFEETSGEISRSADYISLPSAKNNKIFISKNLN